MLHRFVWLQLRKCSSPRQPGPSTMQSATALMMTCDCGNYNCTHNFLASLGKLLSVQLPAFHFFLQLFAHACFRFFFFRPLPFLCVRCYPPRPIQPSSVMQDKRLLSQQQTTALHWHQQSVTGERLMFAKTYQKHTKHTRIVREAKWQREKQN